MRSCADFWFGCLLFRFKINWRKIRFELNKSNSSNAPLFVYFQIEYLNRMDNIPIFCTIHRINRNNEFHWFFLENSHVQRRLDSIVVLLQSERERERKMLICSERCDNYQSNTQLSFTCHATALPAASLSIRKNHLMK